MNQNKQKKNEHKHENKKALSVLRMLCNISNV